MGIDFAAVGLLVLLPAALALTYLLHLAARRRLSRARARASLALRTVVLAALIFALAGTQLVLPVDRLATVFLVDWSDSLGSAGREASTAFLQDALEELPDGDQAGIVVFGADALVERLPSPTRLLERIDSVPSPPPGPPLPTRRPSPSPTTARSSSTPPRNASGGSSFLPCRPTCATSGGG